MRHWEKFNEWSAAHGLRVYLPTIAALERSRVWAGRAPIVQLCSGLDLQTPGAPIWAKLASR